MSVDNRIVQMVFNNKQFESGVAQSVKTLNGLKKSLKLDESAKSLTNLDNVGKKFSLAGIQTGVETISSRFSTLGIIGVTALQNITNSAINTGKRMLSALTVKPILSGLDEYETKINAIQTIMTNTASKGTTLLDVNKVLAELNEYADKTIYNFSQMTKNIGTFTAAGIGLEVAAESIKGIANLAAGSGSTSLQASTAMYQLSQALAAGSLKLQDWNSVVNAGMGGELFQKALKASAKELGIFVDESVPFRESLKDGWISTEVLTNTLSKFANDPALIDAATKVKTFTQLFDTMQESVQSGWAVSWENIIGDKDTATETLTGISDAFNALTAPAADARNAMLKFWNVNGGREAILDALKNSFDGLQATIKPIKEAFRELFPAITGEQLTQISKNIKELTDRFKIGEDTADKLKRTFKGLFSILDIGKTILSALTGGILDLAGSFDFASLDILSVTARMGDFLTNLNETIKRTDIFGITVDGVVSNIKRFGDTLYNIGSGAKSALATITDAFKDISQMDLSGLILFGEKVKIGLDPFNRIGESMNGGFIKVIESLKKTAPVFLKLATVVGEAFNILQTLVVDALEDLDFDGAVDVINSGLLIGIGLGLKKFIDSLTSIADSGSGILGNITGILDGVKGSLEAYQSSLKAKTLLKIAVAIAILAASVIALSLVDSEKLTMALSAMSVMFLELFGSMAIFEKIMGGAGFIGMVKVTTAMVALSVAILILTTAVSKLAKLDWDGLAKGLLGVATLSGILVASAHVLSKNTGVLIKGAIGLVVFAVAINELVKAVERLGKLDPMSLTKGLVGVGVLVAELALFMKVADFGGMGVRVGIGLIGLSTAIIILSKSVEIFGLMDTQTLIKGVVAIGVLLTELALFTKLSGTGKGMIKTAIGLTILGGAMLVFATAIERIGSLEVSTIARGLVGMGGALYIISSSLKAMPRNLLVKGAGLLIIAYAVLKLSEALKQMGEMSLQEIGRSLIVVFGALTILSSSMTAMTKAIPGALALLIVANALRILTPTLERFGNMSLVQIGKGLLTLAGALAVIGLAALVISPILPALFGLGASVTLLGVGLLAAGAGLLLFSTALAALAISGAAGAATLISIVAGLLGLIPLALTKLGEGIVAFAVAVEKGIPALMSALKAVVIAVLDVIVDLTPKLVTGVLVLLKALTDTLLEHAPELIKQGTALIVALLRGISDTILEITAIGVEIMIKFIEGVASMLSEIIQAGFELMLAFINGLADAIDKNTPVIIEAVRNLMRALAEAGILVLKSAIKDFKEVGGNIIDALKKAFTSGKEAISTATTEVITSALDALKTFVSDFKHAGSDLISGFITGIKDKISDVTSAVSDMANGAINSVKDILDINSPSREFREIGKFSAQGMANGLRDYASLVTDASSKVGSDAISSIKNAISKVGDVVRNGMDANPTIRPVLDLTDVIAGAKKLNGMIGQAPVITTKQSTSKAKGISIGVTDPSDIDTDPKKPGSGGSDVNFTQNNYSPKALSRTEIYRNTKNQLGRMKGPVTV